MEYLAEEHPAILAPSADGHGGNGGAVTSQAMTAIPMDGAALAARVRAEVAEEVRELGAIGLATILVGDDPASEIYVG